MGVELDDPVQAHLAGPVLVVPVAGADIQPVAVAVIAVVVLVAVMLGRGADPAPGPTGPVATEAPATGSPDAFAYGDDPYFDALWDSCESGDAQACDDLFQESPVDSEYEEFGASCGGRFPGTEEWCVDVMG